MSTKVYVIFMLHSASAECMGQDFGIETHTHTHTFLVEVHPKMLHRWTGEFSCTKHTNINPLCNVMHWYQCIPRVRTPSGSHPLELLNLKGLTHIHTYTGREAFWCNLNVCLGQMLQLAISSCKNYLEDFLLPHIKIKTEPIDFGLWQNYSGEVPQSLQDFEIVDPP